MLVDIDLPRTRVDGAYAVRVARALDRRRLGAGALVALLLSIGSFLGADALQFLSPAEIMLAWFEHLVELLGLAAVLVLAYTLLDEALPRGMPLRLAIVCTVLALLSGLLTLLLYAYYLHDFEHLPPPGRMLSDTLRWGLPAVALALIADMHQRALRNDAAARAAEVTRRQLGRNEAEQHLALLQAQLEPHFLFNILGNVRRLYRTQPQAGAEAIACLMHYLRAALPLLRNP